MYLHALGWNSFFQNYWDQAVRQWEPGRVVEQQREGYRVVAQGGEIAAEVTGRFRHVARDQSEFPAVGDWVAVEVVEAEGKGLIHEIVPRRTKLSRKTAGERSEEQVLVANVDFVFIVTSLNSDFNPRRVERYLGMVWESGAQPILVLNKADLCAEPERMTHEVARIAPGVNVHAVSGRTGDGLEELMPYASGGHTVVLMGSSGVGKSTIINTLHHENIQVTREIRMGDERGRHATTYRRLFLMPRGGVLIDTPGLRELHLWDSGGLEDTFEEIARLATACRFRDCRHLAEPGCAVQAEIAAGCFDADRLANFHKMEREQEYLERRHNPAALAEQRKRWKQIHKANKAMKKTIQVIPRDDS